MLDKTYDFSSGKRAHTYYGGSDRKFGIIINGNTYMIKFSEDHAKKSDVSTSSVNNVISEYISSHISQSIGLPTHETVLGTYDNELVVGCKDFRDKNGLQIVEFAEYIRAKYDSKDVKRVVNLNQIYETIKDPHNDLSESLQQESIKRYWDTFVVDALVGNFDRHIGNWGYIIENNIPRLAPVYDYGSTLLPQASDQGCASFIDDEYKMMERCLVFPSPALFISDEKQGKPGYYDILSSNYDLNCTEALLRIYPNINLNHINAIIDATPYITDSRKSFYKEYIKYRYENIINRAYLRCLYKEYDNESISRLKAGHQFSVSDLKEFLFDREVYKKYFITNEYYLNKAINEKDESKSTDLIWQQRKLMEYFGLYSSAAMKAILSDPEKYVNVEHPADIQISSKYNEITYIERGGDNEYNDDYENKKYDEYNEEFDEYEDDYNKELYNNDRDER